MRTLWTIAIPVLTIAFSTLSGTVWAQIAAPRLNPVAIDSSIITPNRNIPPFNPAVLPWSGASRVAVARADLEAEVSVLGIAQSTNSGEGTMVQGRYVGEFFSLAAESYQFELKDQTTGTSTDFNGSLIAAAARFGDIFSAGVSQQTGEFVNVSTTNSSTLPLLGATLRIGETFFAGLATGDETLEQTAPGFSGKVDRTVTQFGIAYLSRDDENGLHLEYYRQSVDGYTDPFLGTGNEEESAAFTLEIIFSKILLGFEAMDNEITDTTGTVVEDVALSTISLGWAPTEGFSIVASLREEETTDNTNGSVFNVDTTAISIAWMF